ncbi:hypothetical protein [Aminipila terrae]|uniref:Uncharacterized protein n=1 Tax=Aminipila terrae TaxID=2697030 RepID=A0A6P1MFK1_9FIRM|nr:hypothetical protein [Aminipila terrae]QHI73489.1 hypothetical protein Ami3637_14870 [Aminipila terrae]
MKEEKDNTDYIEDLEEWQDNQYNPGHYLGGKIPGNILHCGRPKMIGMTLIGIGFMTLFPFVLGIINVFQSDESLLPVEYILEFIHIAAFGAFSLVMIINGIRKIIGGTKKIPN